MTRILPVASLVLFVGPAFAEMPSNLPEDGAFISQVTFTCERGVVVPVAYINNAPGHSFAVAQIDGQQIAMIQVVSGSGIRYRSVDAGRPYEFHAKGYDGMFFFGPEEDPATILGECKAE